MTRRRGVFPCGTTEETMMAGIAEFKVLTDGLGLDNDCPLCGQAWPQCNGACVQHETSYGFRGPFHDDFNDDCPECKADGEPAPPAA
jgi:hypothetical protein